MKEYTVYRSRAFVVGKYEAATPERAVMKAAVEQGIEDEKEKAKLSARSVEDERRAHRQGARSMERAAGIR